MPTAPQIDCPISLGGFFPAESDDDDDDDDDEEELNQCFEVQNVELEGATLKIRQFAWHSHNANRVWPGTFNLASYLLVKEDDGCKYKNDWGRVLELGSATGILAIRLAMVSKKHHATKTATAASTGTPLEAIETVCESIVTSDVADGEVGEHVLYNFRLNDFAETSIPVHVPHTWGTGWKHCADELLGGTGCQPFDTIVASDILLYVSAYPALVKSLTEIMSRTTILVMSWNRRMKESGEFFERMDEAGFDCRHEGKCIYTCSWKKKCKLPVGEEQNVGHGELQVMPEDRNHS